MQSPPVSGTFFEVKEDGFPVAKRFSINPQSSIEEKLEWFRSFFRPHFMRSVFGVIDRLVFSRDALVGFILMACAIDYLAGFWWGKSTKGLVHEAYLGFLDEYFPPSHYESEGLYDSLRNGLVHMFTIKDKRYALTHNHPELHLKKCRTGQVIINAADFRNDLVAAAQKYFEDVDANRDDMLNKLVERFCREGFLDVGTLEILN